MDQQQHPVDSPLPKEDMVGCVMALEAALLPCLPARELQAIDRSPHPSHQNLPPSPSQLCCELEDNDGSRQPPHQSPIHSPKRRSTSSPTRIHPTPENRPNNPTARPANNNSILSIDLSSAVRDAVFLLTEIGTACREWGTFHVTNHGVPPKLLDEIKCMGRHVRWTRSSVDVERHARDFMEAAKKLQLYFIGLQREDQPTKAEKLQKEIAIMEEELKTKNELIKNQERMIQGWRKELKDQLERHNTELERV
ncbi:hypothetical protein RJ639_047308 [Escallonia herrerae]|uniref:Non-haem dioxygenase N-terminal domain-containing protein n=1 Tax=Escallonia herrerae TaxID=1293975 RepID=A0AA89B3Y4_9ASTE|nr:hypothetical protein RJ639_047308 [Escallonia herrerae]